MQRLLRKRPWIAIAAVAVVVAVAVFSAARSFHWGQKAVTEKEQVGVEMDVHAKIQQELAEKGIAPKGYGLPSSSQIPGAAAAPTNP